MPPQGILLVHRCFDADPVRDLAVEEALLRQDPGTPPCVYLYGWNRPVLVLGYGQPAETVDLDAARRLGVTVLRRVSGGTGVVHSRDLSVSLVLDADHPVARSIPGLYDRFLDMLTAALFTLGVAVQRPGRGSRPNGSPRSPICFEELHGETLAIEGRKVVGCAQARRRNRVLVHGTILLGLDPDLQAALYRVDPERITLAMAALPLPAPHLPTLPLGQDSRELLADALVAEASTLLGLAASPAPLPDLPPDLVDRGADLRWAPVSTFRSA